MSKENGFLFKFRKISKGRHFTVKTFYIIKLSCILELHKNFKCDIKNGVFFHKISHKSCFKFEKWKIKKMYIVLSTACFS